MEQLTACTLLLRMFTLKEKIRRRLTPTKTKEPARCRKRAGKVPAKVPQKVRESASKSASQVPQKCQTGVAKAPVRCRKSAGKVSAKAPARCRKRARKVLAKAPVRCRKSASQGSQKGWCNCYLSGKHAPLHWQMENHEEYDNFSLHLILDQVHFYRCHYAHECSPFSHWLVFLIWEFFNIVISLDSMINFI